jgi:hypothetical protein
VRGLILWDPDNNIVRPDGSPGPNAAGYAPVFGALRGDIGQRMIDAEPIHDSVAMLYSPVSFRVRWMLDHRPDGDAWMQRSAEIELQDNAFRIALREYDAALAGMGLHPRWIAPEELMNGPPPEKTLILPHAIALSDQEIQAIAAFAAMGGQVIADTQPGLFDGHGRRRDGPSIQAAIVAPRDLKLKPAFQVEAPNNDVDIWLYRSRGRRLLALQRRALGETSETVTIHLDGAHARDIQTNHEYGDTVSLTLDPVTPAFLEIEP